MKTWSKLFFQPLEVVCGHQGGLALAAQPVEHTGDDLAAGGVHGAQGLVEQQQVGVLHEGAGEQGALLLPARELADLPIGQLGEPRLIEHLGHALPVGCPRPPQPAEVDVAPGEDEARDGDGEAPVDLTAPGQVGDPVVAGAHRPPIDADCPGLGPQQPRHCLEQGGLARAVRAHQGRAHPIANRETDGAHGGLGNAGVADAQPVEEQRVGARQGLSAATLPAATVQLQVFAMEFEARVLEPRHHQRRQLQVGDGLTLAADGADELVAAGARANIGAVAPRQVEAGQPPGAAQPVDGAVDRRAAAQAPAHHQLLHDRLGGEGPLGGGDPIEHCRARRRSPQPCVLQGRLHGHAPVGGGTVSERGGQVVWTAHRRLRRVSRG